MNEVSPLADRLSPKRAFALAAGVAAVLFALSLAGLGSTLDRVAARPLEFRAREALGRSPKLASGVKAFAFDDQAVAAFGRTDLTLGEWTAVLSALAAARPRMILIDKTFSHALADAPDGAVRAAKDFATALAALRVPIVAKAEPTSEKVPLATELAAERFGVSLAKLVSPVGGSHGKRAPSWLPETVLHLYGPSPDLAPAFTFVGHDQDAQGGVVEPLVNAGSTIFVPHWALFAAGQVHLEGAQLMAGSYPVPLDGSGSLTVNVIPEAASRQALRSLAVVAAAIHTNQSVPGIDPGDTVVILPSLYAAAGDHVETPLGPQPAAFLQLALVNSAASGAWLWTLPIGLPLTALFCMAGAALALVHERRTFAPLTLGLGLAFAAAAVAAFVFGGVIVPWALPLTGFLVSGYICRSESVKHAERRAALLRHDLHGILSPEHLQSLDRRSLHHLEATEQVVTIMFVDIVGFSRAAEKQTPKEAFSSLKSLIDQLRRTVHDFGGVVDRTMGDGMLCVFGYAFAATGQNPLTHAEQAAHCAAKIQHDNLKRMLKAAKTNQAVFPLRIGINTAGVYLGNLGDTERTDLTVIGNGVNFAQRLEAACDRHMAMLGASTRDLLIDQPALVPMLRKRHIRVKHATELTEAYELDPFFDDPQLLFDGDEAYRQFTGIERGDERHPIPYPGLIKVMTNYGDGEMINFSLDGFTIKLSEYYAKDVTISLRMDTDDGILGERLESLGMASLMLEVRWARPAGDGYIHGCLIKNLSAEQREGVIAQVRDSIKRHVAAARRTA